MGGNQRVAMRGGLGDVLLSVGATEVGVVLVGEEVHGLIPTPSHCPLALLLAVHFCEFV